MENMGEQSAVQASCNVVATYQPYLKRNVETLGDAFTWYISLIHQPLREPEPEPEPIEEEAEEPEENIVFEDDVEYLRSLDPKEWKEQDHYAVLGIKKLRIKASDDVIKRAYRKKVLKHHPDKRKAQGEEIRPDDDYFTCITRAYETLGTPLKRRSYDSVDPEFDDSLPTASEAKQDFFRTFRKYFDLNARWSEKKNVPKLGNDKTSRQEVEKFYSFWYNFESWREYSYQDEEEKERGQDREERRWIEKQNKAVRAKRKKEEMTRIRTLVDLAYNNDPRIARFKQEEKDRKTAAKRAKQDAAQARRDEEERLLKEAQLAKDKAEAAERSRIDAIRMEREAQKRALKKERKAFRDHCKSNEYFSTNPSDRVEHMAAVEKICEMLKMTELQDLNKDIKSGGRKVFLRVIKETEEKLEAERRALFEPVVPKSNTTSAVNNGKSSVMKPVSTGQVEWSLELVQLLIKAVNLFPAGTNQRWEVIANFLNQHHQVGDNAVACKITAKDVLNKAKSMQNTDFSKNTLKTMASESAFDCFEKDKKNARVVDETSISYKTDETNSSNKTNPISMTNGMSNGLSHQNGTDDSANKKSKKITTNNKLDTNNTTTTTQVTTNGKHNNTDDSSTNKPEQQQQQSSPLVTKAEKKEVPWSKTEQALLEQAIKTFPASTPERWDRIAECLPNRTKKDCMRRFKELVDMIKAKKQAQQELNIAASSST